VPSLRIVIPLHDIAAYPDPLTKSAKTALAHLLAHPAAPAPRMPPPHWSVRSEVIWVSDEMAAQLDALAARYPELAGRADAATSLLHAGARGVLPSVDEAAHVSPGDQQPSPLDHVNRSRGQQTTAEQGRFYDAVRAYLASATAGQVLFAEGATGTGKTRAFLAAGMEWALQRKRSVIVATPTLALLEQCLREAQSLAVSGSLQCSVVPLVGMNEFVAARQVDEWIAQNNELEAADDLRRWRDRGAPAPTTALVQRAWTVAGLLAACPDFAFIDDLRLTSYDDEQDEGKQSYRQQFADGVEATVVICTHAMLASDVRLRMIDARKQVRAAKGKLFLSAAASEFFAREKAERGRLHEAMNDILGEYVDEAAARLPSDALVIVDEAHQLEQSFATIFGYGISLWRLTTDLKALRSLAPRAFKPALIAAAQEAWEQLQALGHQSDAETMPLGDERLSDALRTLGRALATTGPLGSGNARRTPEYRRLTETKTCLQVVDRAAGKYGMFGLVAWSPTRNYPRLVFGRSDVSAELDFLWSVAAHASMAVSATLYERHPQLSVDSIRRQLAVRPDRVATMSPVVPSWVTSPVTLVLPAERQTAPDAPDRPGWIRFARPNSRDKLDATSRQRKYELWLSDVTAHIGDYYRTAPGGMLVLGTAYADLREIAERLRRSEVVSDPRALLVQREGLALSTLRERFLALSRAGVRPLLLALGGAWTGLDLSPNWSIAAAEDNVLTDLVLLNAPIAVNRTITHMRRREVLGPHADIAAATITFRQGIGRLVRRPGLPSNRRLHFLDGRMYDPAWGSYMQPLRRALSNYTRRVYA